MKHPIYVYIPDLHIIGYAGVILQEFTPTTLTPIYASINNDDSILIPPYITDGVYVKLTRISNKKMLEQAVLNNRATMLKTPIDTHINYTLWMDTSMVVRYNEKAFVTEMFSQWKENKYKEALGLFSMGYPYEALDKLNEMLFSSKDIKIHILKAAILGNLGKTEDIKDILSHFSE